MNSTAIDFVRILAHIETVVESKLLTENQKTSVLTEIGTSLPADFFCASCMHTRQIIEGLIKETTVAVKEPKKASKRTPKTKKSEHGEGELF